jgi:hypothetical protein
MHIRNRHIPRNRADHHEPVRNLAHHQPDQPTRTLCRQQAPRNDLGLTLDAPLVQAAQNVVPVAVTAGDKIEGLRQWASGR